MAKRKFHDFKCRYDTLTIDVTKITALYRKYIKGSNKKELTICLDGASDIVITESSCLIEDLEQEIKEEINKLDLTLAEINEMLLD